MIGSYLADVLVYANFIALCFGQGTTRFGQGTSFTPRGEDFAFPGGLPGFGTRGLTRYFGTSRFTPRFDSGGFAPSSRSSAQTCPDGSLAYRECFDDTVCGSGFCYQQYTARGVCCRDISGSGSIGSDESMGTSGGTGSFSEMNFAGSSTGMEQSGDMGFGGGLGGDRGGFRSNVGGLMSETGTSSSGGGMMSSATSSGGGEGACPEVTTRTCGDGPPPGRECFAQDAVCPSGQECCPDPCGYICKNRR